MNLCAQAQAIREEHLRSALSAESSAARAAEGSPISRTYKTHARGARHSLARKVEAHMARCGLCSK